MKKLFLLLIFALVSHVGSAQQIQFRIDSLKLELAKPQHDTTRVRALRYLSGWYSSYQIDSAIAYAKKSLSLAQSVQFSDGIAWGNIILAFSLAERDIPKSMAMLYEIIKQNQGADLSSKQRVVDCNYSIGLLYLYLRNPKQAINLLQLARKLQLQLDKRLVAIAGYDREIGAAFFNANQLDSARFYLTRVGKEDPGEFQQPIYLYYCGLAEVDRNPALARQLFRKSFHLAQQSDNLRELSLSSRRLGEFYLNHTPELDSAIYVAKIGVQAAQTMALYRGIYYNGLILAEAYKRLRIIDSAYKYQTLMLAARDSVFSLDKFNQVQTTVIEEQQRVQVLEEEKSRFRIYGLIALILGLFGLAGILYRNQRKTQKANALLQYQRDEIHQQRTQLQHSLETLRTTQTQLIQKEKLASLGELTAGIAHEIQNPLNFVNNFSEVSAELVSELEEEQKKPDRDTELETELLSDLKQNLQKISHHGGRASAIVKGMLEHSRASTGEKQPTNLNQLADEYLRLAYHGLRARNKDFNAQLITNFDTSLSETNLVAQDIGRVLLNLYNNAFYAVQQRQLLAEAGYKPTIWVGTTRTNGHVEIRVKDNGTGIPTEIVSKVFQPFFTTKPTGEGTGLGLSLSYDIITKGHGGTLEVETKEGEGSEFVVKLPLN